MQAKAKAACWRTAGMTIISLVILGFMVSIVTGA